MRHIDRNSVETPKSLVSESARAAKRRVAEHLALPSDSRRQRRAPFNLDILHQPDTIEALVSLHLGKCAFCEGRLNSEFEAHIDHYRPKANAVLKAERQSLDRYCWFAYEWENLAFVCATCRSIRGTKFPIAGKSSPVLSTWREANAIEQPLLINPFEDDPEKLLAFSWKGVASGSSRKATSTVDAFGLNRASLVESRLEHINSLRNAIDRLRTSENGEPSELVRFIDDAAPFAGACRYLLYDLAHKISHIRNVSAPGRLETPRWVASFLLGMGDEIFAPSPESLPFRPSQFGEVIAVESEASRSRRIDRNVSRVAISKVEINNFKAIRELSIELNPSGKDRASCLTILGENATGKTSLLQAIALNLMSEEERSRLRLEPEDFLSREPNTWDFVGDRECHVRVYLTDGSVRSLSIDPQVRSMVGEHRSATVVHAYGAHRTFGKTWHRYTQKTSETLFRSSVALGNPTGWLTSLTNREFDAVARALRDLLMLADSDEVFRGDSKELFIRANGRVSPVNQLSEGYKAVFSMVMDSMRSLVKTWGNLEDAYGIVLVDEIEANLHPRWKLRIMASLRSALPNVQFISTTHDPLCLRGLGKGEVMVLVSEQDGDISAVENLPDVRLLRAEQLLTSDFFGLSSTADPLTQSQIDAVANSEFQPQRESAVLLAEIRRDVLAAIPIGDSPSEQLVYEAIRRFVSSRDKVSVEDRSELREDAIDAVLRALEEIDKKSRTVEASEKSDQS